MLFDHLDMSWLASPPQELKTRQVLLMFGCQQIPPLTTTSTKIPLKLCPTNPPNPNTRPIYSSTYVIPSPNPAPLHPSCLAPHFKTNQLSWTVGSPRGINRCREGHGALASLVSVVCHVSYAEFYGWRLTRLFVWIMV
ncbi:hypothetical protein CHARACLAT_003832 [Characodon lateralis]|uniref:Uncharacterized protein n=1 Tax=Characodon lateralis TaxID=208331 RepID=A0ABU7D6S0_9TELE|nr:hypothetical protein [Characodon lateralis]